MLAVTRQASTDMQSDPEWSDMIVDDPQI